MNIVGLNEILRANAARVILVNSFYSEDVYKILNTKEVKYPAMVFNIQSTTENTNSRTFNGILYYADKLNEDFSNESMIHDASNTAIGSFINSLRDSETEDISVSNYTITNFEQKFADECAGGYANLAITVTNDCSVSEVLKFIEVETDPVFKASPAAKITDAMIEKWDENSVSIEQVDEEIESKLSEKNYATKDEIPSVEGLASEEYVNEQIEAVRDEIPSLDGYATEQWVEEKNYATKDEIPSVEGLASEEWVNEQGFLTEHQPLPDYSNTYAMKEHTHPEYVNPDYSTTYQPIGDYATRSEIPSLDGYATEQWVENKGYLTEHQDLSEYAKKEELPDLEPYATKQYVQDQIIEAGAVTIEQVDAEIESKLSEKNYATKDEIPSVEGLASEQWVEEQGYLTEHQPLPDYSNTYAAKVHEHPEYVNPDYSTTYQPIGDYATRSEIPSLDGYATEQWVENKNYATKDEIPSVEGLASEEYVNGQIDSVRSEIPSVEGLASEEWVNEQGFLTEHQSLKTINGESIVGEGDIEIQGGGVTEDKVEELIDAHDFATVSQLDSYFPITGGTLTLEEGVTLRTGIVELGIGKSKYKSSYIATSRSTFRDGELTNVTEPVYYSANGIIFNTSDGSYTLAFPARNGIIATEPAILDVIEERGILSNYNLQEAPNYDKNASFRSKSEENLHSLIDYRGLWAEDTDTKKSIFYAAGYIKTGGWNGGKLNIPTIPSGTEETIATEEWVEDKNYLTEHQSLKTINNQSIIGTGNIEIQGGSGVTEEKVEELIGAHDFATQSQLSSYLPLSGGTMTGHLHIGSATDTNDPQFYIERNIGDNTYKSFTHIPYSDPCITSEYSVNETDKIYMSLRTDGLYVGKNSGKINGNKVVVASELASYLPLSGGTITGPITLNGGGQYRYAYAYSPIVKESSDAASWCPAMCVRSTSYDFSIGTVNDRFRFVITDRDSTTNYRTDYLLPVRSTDKNTNETITTEEWVGSRYLPLTGGTASTFAVNLSVNNSKTALYGGQNYQSGAFIELHGKTHSTRPGYFMLSAGDGTTRKDLTGKPDGTLTWGNNNVVTAANFSFDASTGTLSITM